MTGWPVAESLVVEEQLDFVVCVDVVAIASAPG
jgi:hypothetical protein